MNHLMVEKNKNNKDSQKGQVTPKVLLGIAELKSREFNLTELLPGF